MDFLIHWPPGPVVATVQCQGLHTLHKHNINNYDKADEYSTVTPGGLTLERCYNIINNELKKTVRTLDVITTFTLSF